MKVDQTSMIADRPDYLEGQLIHARCILTGESAGLPGLRGRATVGNDGRRRRCSTLKDRAGKHFHPLLRSEGPWFTRTADTRSDPNLPPDSPGNIRRTAPRSPTCPGPARSTRSTAPPESRASVCAPG